MRISNAVVALALFGCTETAVIDGKKAIEATAEWKAAQADIQTWHNQRQADIDAARAAAKKAEEFKAPADEQSAARKHADELASQVQSEEQQRKDSATQRIATELQAFLPEFARQKHVRAIGYVGSYAYVDQAADVSAALAAAFDADRAKKAGMADTDARVRELQAKLSALEAKQAQQTATKKP